MADLNDRRKNMLLLVARDSLAACLCSAGPVVTDTDDSVLREHRGCFVTLKNQDKLRGCIGLFVSKIPLIELVAEMAVAAATSDPRFCADPVTAGELKDLEIEISVLSPLRPTDRPLDLRLGTDGIYVRRGLNSGCFLPQVATESGWNAEEFLSICCSHKAGLPSDAWKDSGTEVYLFTAEVFSAPFADI